MSVTETQAVFLREVLRFVRVKRCAIWSVAGTARHH